MSNWSSLNQFAGIDSMSDSRLRRLERGSQYLRRGVVVNGSGNYSRVPSSLLTGTKISLASPHLALSGSIPPSGVSGNFGFSATTTSITIYWDGTNSSKVLAVLRADGSVVNIPTGSLTISGLTAGTTYGFLPFWNVYNSCGIGWVVGDSGSPQFAFSAAGQTAIALSQQSLQGREPLTTTYMTYATPASGTNSGTGGGGGSPGRCVMLGTDIEPLGDLDYKTIHHPQTDWIRIVSDYPRALNCTPNHPLYHADKGKVRADEFKDGDWIITDSGERKVYEVTKFLRVCTKMEVQMESGHLFYANGYLSHNMKYYTS